MWQGTREGTETRRKTRCGHVLLRRRKKRRLGAGLGSARPRGPAPGQVCAASAMGGPGGLAPGVASLAAPDTLSRSHTPSPDLVTFDIAIAKLCDRRDFQGPREVTQHGNYALAASAPGPPVPSEP